MNINNVKTILRDRGFVVLDDMQGPVDLNCGQCIAAVTYDFPAFCSDEGIASQIEGALPEGRKFFSYYTSRIAEDGRPIIRYASFVE